MFSRRHDVGKGELIEMALALELDEVTAMLAKIFPKESGGKDIMAGLDEQVSGADVHGGYPEIHRDIIEPIKDIRALLNEISTAITNFYEAYG